MQTAGLGELQQSLQELGPSSGTQSPGLGAEGGAGLSQALTSRSAAAPRLTSELSRVVTGGCLAFGIPGKLLQGQRKLFMDQKRKALAVQSVMISSVLPQG